MLRLVTHRKLTSRVHFCTSERNIMSATASTEPKTTKLACKQPWFQLDENSTTNEPVVTENTGVVPLWLEGSLYRNGSGIFKVGETPLKHLFDGFSILHRFTISKGKVTYFSHILDSESWQRSIKANRLVTSQFATYAFPDPCKSLLSKVASYFKPMIDESTDNTSVNIVELGDRLYALTETPWMNQVDPEKLTVVGKENLRNVIAVHLSTAHPHFDSDGNMYNLGTAFNPPNNYNIIKIPPQPNGSETREKCVSKAQLLASLTSRWRFNIGYNHSFGMSSDHFIILEQPITMATFKFLIKNWTQSAPFDNFEKHPKEELVFRIVRRSDNKEVLNRYRAEPAFTFHFVNCFEDSGHLVVDFVGYSSLDIMDELYVEALDKEGQASSVPSFRRYVLPLDLDKAEEGKNLVNLPYTNATATLRTDGTVFLKPDPKLEQVSFELPQINYVRCNARKYQYAYGTKVFSAEPQLIKVNLEDKSVVTWQDKGYMPGEPVFVPKPDALDEDDGVILSAVISMKEDMPCFLLILDAKTFQEVARAKAPVGLKMAFTFHGLYRPLKQ